MKVALSGKKGRDKFALVDDVDAALVAGLKWFLHSEGYVTARGSGTLMHRLLLDAGKGVIVDHKNGDRLDNRRSNLRPCSRSENMANSGLPAHNTSGYRGVTRDSYTGKWKAAINISGKHINLGRFDSPEEAAIIYDEAVIKHFGQFARPNLP